MKILFGIVIFLSSLFPCCFKVWNADEYNLPAEEWYNTQTGEGEFYFLVITPGANIPDPEFYYFNGQIDHIQNHH